MSFAKFEASLFCGRCGCRCAQDAALIRLLPDSAEAQVFSECVLHWESAVMISASQRPWDFLWLSMTFLILYRFLSVFLSRKSVLFCWVPQCSDLPHLPHLWRPLHTGLYWLPLRSGTWLRPTDRLRPHWTGRFCIDSAFVDVTHSTPAAGWLSAIPVHVQVCAKAISKVTSYHSLGETLGTFGNQKMSESVSWALQLCAGEQSRIRLKSRTAGNAAWLQFQPSAQTNDTKTQS